MSANYSGMNERGQPAVPERGAGNEEHQDARRESTPPPPQNRKLRRVLRLVGWNALVLVAGLTLVGAVAEVWLRLTMPFIVRDLPLRFVPGAGLTYEPDVEVHWTDRREFWTVSRTNSLGFLDREPVSAERAAASCHVAMIGDSFVEAKQVPIVEKFHVRLEELAARDLPHLDVTTSAFGFASFGQINQLPFYDEFARHLHPKLLVLVFVRNDFRDNMPVLDALQTGRGPARLPWVAAERNEDGTITLHPPVPGRKFAGQRLVRPWWYRLIAKPIIRTSYLANWLRAIRPILFPPRFKTMRLIEEAKILSWRPPYPMLLDGWQPMLLGGWQPTLLDGWQPTTQGAIDAVFFHRKELPSYFESALDFTAFALDQFKERAEHDGVSLVILSTDPMRTRGHPLFDRLSALAETRGIPVIDQYDYILRQGARPEDAHWAHDGHWNAVGHQWAAEALLEYLKRNQGVCAQPSPPRQG